MDAWYRLLLTGVLCGVLSAALGVGSGIVGAVIGAKIVALLPGSTIRKAFAVLMIVAAVNMLWKNEPPAKQVESGGQVGK